MLHRVCLAPIAILLPTVLAAADWKPIEPAHLELATPRVDPAADAEAIFWEVRIDDEAKEEFALEHYLRIKVFTQQGAEAQAAVELQPFIAGAVGQVRGRTIQPDGSILELSSDAVFERELLNARKLSVRTVSFALPGVEPGAIVEYRWRERHEGSANYLPIAFQREIPVWLVKYFIRPSTRLSKRRPMRSQAFQCPHTPYEAEPDGFVSTTLTHVAAFLPEPQMPPPNSTLAWVLLYYPIPFDGDLLEPPNPDNRPVQVAARKESAVPEAVFAPGDAESAAANPFAAPSQLEVPDFRVDTELAFDPSQIATIGGESALHRLLKTPPQPPRRTAGSFTVDPFWRKFGRALDYQFQRDIDAKWQEADHGQGFRLSLIWNARRRVSRKLVKTAESIVGDALLASDKLDRIYDYCRTTIQNIDTTVSAMTSKERTKASRNKSPSDTLARRAGTGRDINLLFAALATGAGIDVAPVRMPDRSFAFFDRSFKDPYFLRSEAVAVRTGLDWWIYDASHAYAPPRTLRWQNEGVEAFIGLPDGGTFVRTRYSDPESSRMRRLASLRLKVDGSVEGSVRGEFGGHPGAARRQAYDRLSEQERAERLRKAVLERLPEARLSNIRFENVSNPAKLFVYQYDVSVPNYAQATLSRLLFHPSFFRQSDEALFPASQRKQDVYIPYPWLEEDVVTIELPAGYEIENPESPGAVSAEGFGRYEAKLQLVDGRRLVYRRKAHFAQEGMALIPAAKYAVLKQLFDFVHRTDRHTVVLRSPAPNGGP